MQNTFELALLGAITGIIGTTCGIINLWYAFNKERPRLSIQHPNDNRGMSILGYATDYSRRDAYGSHSFYNPNRLNCWVWLRMVNQSDKPITVFELALSLQNNEVVFLTSSTMVEAHATTQVTVVSVDTTHGTTHSVNDLIYLPFALNPYDAIEGNFFFSPVTSIPQDGTTAKLIVRTSRKDFKEKIKMKFKKPVYNTSVMDQSVVAPTVSSIGAEGT